MNKQNSDAVITSYAIFQAGGRQYQAVVGSTLALNRMDGDVGASVVFDEVLLKRTEKKCEVGQPFVKGAKVKASIVKHLRGDKLTVFKMKRRKKYRVKQGHRQELTVVRFESI